MIRTSLRYFYNLGAAFHPLTELLTGKKVVDVWGTVNDANNNLTGLASTDNFVGKSLRTSWEAAHTLQTVLKEILAEADWNKELDFITAYRLQSAVKDFESKFTGELHVADAYFVTQKGGLDTVKIISDATVLFHADLSAKVPGAVADVREAGKCIAFELPTAAGFHLFRAIESVLRRYFEVVSNNARKPGNRSIAAYLRTMEKLGVGEPKVIAVLDQIRDLHRNPVSHPEENLALDEALDLLGIARSAISAMLRKIPMPPLELKATPGLLNVPLEEQPS